MLILRLTQGYDENFERVKFKSKRNVQKAEIYHIHIFKCKATLKQEHEIYNTIDEKETKDKKTNYIEILEVNQTKRWIGKT